MSIKTISDLLEADKEIWSIHTQKVNIVDWKAIPTHPVEKLPMHSPAEVIDSPYGVVSLQNMSAILHHCTMNQNEGLPLAATKNVKYWACLPKV